MAEKRKPDFILLIRSERFDQPEKRKSQKIELFDSKLWTVGSGYKKRYRMRVNGKWFSSSGKYGFYNKWEIRDILWRSIKL